MTDVFDKQTLELTLKASNEGIWDWNIKCDSIFYSERTQEFLGYPTNIPPNIMTNPQEIVHDDSLEHFQNTLSLVLLDSDTEHLKLDCKILRPDGKSRWIRIRGIIIRDIKQPVRIAGSMIDISNRKFAEEMIAEERNMLRLVIDNIPLQVYFKDTKSRYKLVNQRQVSWLGKNEADELIGKSGESFFSPESWDASRKEELQIMKTGKPVIDVIQKERWPHKPDTYVQKVKHPWYNSSGKLLGTYGISCDVTSLIQSKKKLESLAISLQKQHKNYQEELMLATEIQRAILPENSPEWNHTIAAWTDKLHLKTLYAPASELAGDFYDVINVSEHQLGFLIIDVIGHGVRSAIIVSLIRGLMEQAEYLLPQPALYMEEINNGLNSILQKSSITLFASACFTLLDFESDKISIVTAGHNFPIIKFNGKIDSEKHHLTDESPALGSLAETKYPETIYQLTNIKSILLFTDGIYEATNNHDIKWGVDNLRLELDNAQFQDNSSSVDHIYKMATQWMGHTQFKDDVCLLNLEII